MPPRSLERCRRLPETAEASNERLERSGGDGGGWRRKDLVGHGHRAGEEGLGGIDVRGYVHDAPPAANPGGEQEQSKRPWIDRGQRLRRDVAHHTLRLLIDDREQLRISV